MLRARGLIAVWGGAIVGMFLAGPVAADVVVQYTFHNGTSNTYAPTTVAPLISGATAYDTNASGLAFSTSVPPGGSPTSVRADWPVKSQPYYFGFGFTVDSRYLLTLDSVSFYEAHEQNGPATWQVLYSTDNFATSASLGSGATGPTKDVWYSHTANNGGTPVAGLDGAVSIRLVGVAANNGRYWSTDSVTVHGTLVEKPAIALSNPVDATVIAGGEAELGLTVVNTGGSTLGSYSISPSSVAGVADDPPDPGPQGLGPGNGRGHAIRARTTDGVTPVGQNVVDFTVGSPEAWNAPQVIQARLNVLAHSRAAFDNLDAYGSLSPDARTLTIDFGTVALNAGGGALESTFDIRNVLAVAGFTAGLDLDLLTAGTGNVGALFKARGDAAYANLPAGSVKSYAYRLDTTTAGTFVAEYEFRFSDQDLSGATAPESDVLTVRLTGDVVPEPATALLVAVGAVAIAWRRRRVGD